MAGFRVRSADRDRAGDRRQQQQLSKALAQALRETLREIGGLEARLELANTMAISRLDSAGEYGERAVEEEAEITAAEGAARRARERLEVLRHRARGLGDLVRLANSLYDSASSQT